MVATVHTGSLYGVDALGVVVEISQACGLPGFDIVGLPEAALRESRVRVMAALSNSGYQLPDRHFIVNLAPADFRKSGSFIGTSAGSIVGAQIANGMALQTLCISARSRRACSEMSPSNRPTWRRLARC